MKKLNLFLGGVCMLSILATSSCKIEKKDFVIKFSYTLNEGGESYTLNFTEDFSKKSEYVTKDLNEDSGTLSNEVEELKIPSSHLDLPVTNIVAFNKEEQTMFGDNLQHYRYENYSKLRDITLPDTLESFDGSFLTGFELKSAKYNTERYIKSESNEYFYLMKSESKFAEKIDIHSDCAIIGSSVFKDFWFESIELPNNLKAIGSSAFWESRLKSITLPDGLLYIGGAAFSNSYLEALEIPGSVKKIGSSPVASNTLVTVDSNNLNYSIVGEALIENKTKKLLELPKDSLIPEDCLIIGKNSIDWHSDNLVIPEGVEEIEDIFFHATNVYLPSTLEKVGDVRFQPGDVYYPFSISSFKKQFSILFESYSHKSNTTVHCSDGTIDLSNEANYKKSY